MSDEKVRNELFWQSHESWMKGMGYPEHMLPLISTVREVIFQDRGKRSAWAGMWTKCEECGEHFAFGGNWSEHNEKDPPKKCPLHRLVSALIDSVPPVEFKKLMEMLDAKNRSDSVPPSEPTP